MKIVLFTFSLVVILTLPGCRNSSDLFQKEKPFQSFKPPVPYTEAMAKADSIVQLMSPEEKIAMTGGHNIFFTKGYQKYDIPSIRFSDATQGVSLVDFKDHLSKSVAFPAPLMLTSTWNTELSQAYARSVGEECRAGGIAVLLGPGLNIYRSAQCGRNFEYFGEDPFLTARMIENYVVGLQNTGTIATLKHFIANNSDFRRRTSNSIVSERALHEIYMPGFEAGINAGAMAVMTSYNQLNGEYTAQSGYVIRKLLRGDLGFRWLVMSDWLSIWDAEKALKSGLDLDMPGETEDGVYHEDDPEKYLRREAPALIQQSKVTEADIDRMVKNILTTIFAMQARDHTVKETSYLQNYNDHIEVAVETARQGIVLLKNDNQILPLNPQTGDTILVCGLKVDTLATGGGAAFVEGFDHVSLLDALKRQFEDQVVYAKNPSNKQIKDASQVIYSIHTYDTEGSDVPFDLPDKINNAVKRIAKLNDNVVIVMYTGGGKNMTPWNDRVAAVLYCWYPGQAGNLALAEIIAGKTNPSARLPITIEKDFTDSPAYPYLPDGEELYTGWELDFDMEHPIHDILYDEGIFIGYRWYDQNNIEPLYPFGHGLSYSSYRYSNLSTNADNYDIGQDINVRMEVSNTSAIDGKEIVQLYVRDVQSSVPRPPKELKDFRKVQLKSGETKKVYFTLQARDFAFWDEMNSAWKVEPGDFEIMAGSSSKDIKLTEMIKVHN